MGSLLCFFCALPSYGQCTTQQAAPSMNGPRMPYKQAVTPQLAIPWLLFIISPQNCLARFFLDSAGTCACGTGHNHKRHTISVCLKYNGVLSALLVKAEIFPQQIWPLQKGRRCTDSFKRNCPRNMPSFCTCVSSMRHFAPSLAST